MESGERFLSLSRLLEDVVRREVVRRRAEGDRLVRGGGRGGGGSGGGSGGEGKEGARRKRREREREGRPLCGSRRGMRHLKNLVSLFTAAGTGVLFPLHHHLLFLSFCAIVQVWDGRRGIGQIFAESYWDEDIDMALTGHIIVRCSGYANEHTVWGPRCSSEH